LIVYIFDSLSLFSDIEGGIGGILGVGKEVFGLFSEDFDVLLVPHGIVDSVYFGLFVSNCIVELIKVVNVPRSAFIVFNGILPAVL
jgi:hypothetical protein